MQPKVAARHLRVWRIVERRVSNPKNRAVSVAQLCQDTKVSPRTLHSVCHEFSGMSVKAYLTQERMQLALDMLHRARPGKVTVADVAISCGFAHVSRFADTFRRHHGQLPSQILYRTSARRASQH